MHAKLERPWVGEVGVVMKLEGEGKQADAVGEKPSVSFTTMACRDRRNSKLHLVASPTSTSPSGTVAPSALEASTVEAAALALTWLQRARHCSSTYVQKTASRCSTESLPKACALCTLRRSSLISRA